MEKKEYIEKLNEFISEKKLSLFEYYYLCATLLRSSTDCTLPEFESHNPFLENEDIIQLLNSNDEYVPEYYAYIMHQIVSSQQEVLPVSEKIEEISKEDISSIVSEELDLILSRDEIEAIVNEQLESATTQIVLTSINRKIADLLNGFAVVKEEKTGRAHLYYHNAKEDSLKGEQVFLHNQLKVDSGYYVNFEDYLSHMLDEIIDAYPTLFDISFVRDDGVEMTLNEVREAAFAFLVQQGVLRYGKELKGKNFHTYQEYQDLGIDSTDDYAGESVQAGIYVRRDAITRFFANFKVKVVTLKDETEKNAVK